MWISRERQIELDRIFQRAEEQQEKGNLKAAFRLFLTGAKRGDLGCQVNLGNFYCDGIGVKPNRDLALYWYRRAYRRGFGCAAINIGVLFRDEKKLDLALSWFERAVKLDDLEAHMDIARIYLETSDSAKATRHLKAICKAKPYQVTEASREEALRLLKALESKGTSGAVRR